MSVKICKMTYCILTMNYSKQLRPKNAMQLLDVAAIPHL